DDGALGALMALTMGLRSSEVFRRVVRDLDQGGTVLRISGAKTRKGNRAVQVPEALRPLLLQRAHGRKPEALLFSTGAGKPHTTSWLRSALERLCPQAGVPYVCTHGLRGTFASLAEQVNTVSSTVAAHLGHESVRTTHGHYARPEAVAAGQQTR